MGDNHSFGLQSPNWVIFLCEENSSFLAEIEIVRQLPSDRQSYCCCLFTRVSHKHNNGNEVGKLTEK